MRREEEEGEKRGMRMQGGWGRAREQQQQEEEKEKRHLKKVPLGGPAEPHVEQAHTTGFRQSSRP